MLPLVHTSQVTIFPIEVRTVHQFYLSCVSVCEKLGVMTFARSVLEIAIIDGVHSGQPSKQPAVNRDDNVHVQVEKKTRLCSTYVPRKLAGKPRTLPQILNKRGGHGMRVQLTTHQHNTGQPDNNIWTRTRAAEHSGWSSSDWLALIISHKISLSWRPLRHPSCSSRGWPMLMPTVLISRGM